MKSKKTKNKAPIDLAVKKAYDDAYQLLSTVVTEARVRKFILKFIDDGLLPSELKPTDLGKICKILPKAIYEDILKEEKEIAEKTAEHTGKISATLAIAHAKALILGK